MQSQTDLCAAAIRDASSPTVGITPEIIFSIAQILLPALASAWRACHPGQNASAISLRESLVDHFDPTTRQFDAVFVANQRPATRRAARKSGNPGLTIPQLDAITQASLYQAMNSDDETVSMVFWESDRGSND